MSKDILKTESLNELFENSFKKYWDYKALTEFNGQTLYYSDLARRIRMIHIGFEKCGLKKGDKVALCGKNQSNWAVAFLATISYGAVVVPILHEFKPGNIQHLVNHSDARIFFVGEQIWEGLNEAEMPNLEAIVELNDFSILYTPDKEIINIRKGLEKNFTELYPEGMKPEDVRFHRDQPEELALINYTSGTTGFSKGVMLPYRSLLSNVLFAWEVLPQVSNGARVVSMLPSAHMYGLMFELLFEMTSGSHVHFLTRMPSPKVIVEAFQSVKPRVIIAVPMIIEKIYKQKLLPLLKRPSIKVMLRMPFIDQRIKNRIHDELVKAFGGEFVEIIVGGAPLNHEVEPFLKSISLAFTVGYGLTECGPIVSYAPWNERPLFSCGRAAPRMSIRIDSEDPETVPGEIQLKGDNVMVGYYKNPEATEQVFTEDGWFRTGDMGTMDKDGYLYIKGRSKTIILGPNGQNIYPEEIESSINNMSYVNESLVIMEDNKLVALVYPDFEKAAAEGLPDSAMDATMEAMRAQINLDLPKYCQIARVRIVPEEFEKTPKKSIKRFLYNG
ncbi:MAG TPA: AMP-binding protein [Bacteroidales bacterium]|jgi:long-chain acyl-CoA synthetase|nr:AMP-binding protein [Bacteroidales bacterium]MCZ2417943.1 AMP-binding protein [Burkholderiales bacterium]OQC57155.1 MAG: Long-chain-fatty-acid--CoA ligase FadD15 [Bacteroidetes bacterium ADurb.Bin013]MBP8999195.1 AMP-binding protein [Bacteroidales bacterium]MBV6456695.1 Long-chain-fatty-acid--CoA ligase FadD15 [Bacteroidales bacterium]